MNTAIKAENANFDPTPTRDEVGAALAYLRGLDIALKPLTKMHLDVLDRYFAACAPVEIKVVVPVPVAEVAPEPVVTQRQPRLHHVSRAGDPARQRSRLITLAAHNLMSFRLPSGALGDATRTEVLRGAQDRIETAKTAKRQFDWLMMVADRMGDTGFVRQAMTETDLTEMWERTDAAGTEN